MSEDLYAAADFCLIPMGVEASVGPYIAKVLEKSGLKFTVRHTSFIISSTHHAHSLDAVRSLPDCLAALKPLTISGYGTNIEGPWTEVCKAIQDCHKAVHEQGAPRIATDIRIGTRTDRDAVPGTVNDGKLARVQQLLKEGEGVSQE
ncbi:SubName: Full=Uncharacterized protein {ECO:0000313/EMBL:CCA70582.1} [Serendipita indica DSM 11827]|nr:SubName: Full=Uncharacterized protein {ECO:0000313/EMBL:CCA70582.1} [Serendipita indica DSM 11827]